MGSLKFWGCTLRWSVPKQPQGVVHGIGMYWLKETTGGEFRVFWGASIRLLYKVYRPSIRLL